MPLRETLSNTWDHVQWFLFPMLREETGPLTAQHQRLVVVLEIAGVEAFVRTWPGLPGRPLKDRHALARSFVAKAVLGLATTAALIERLAVDRTLRRLCGWEPAASVPSESTFSRAFAEFARSGLPARAHEALIKQTHRKSPRRAHIARRDGDRGAREAGADRACRKSAEAQAWSAEERRGGASEGAKATGASGRHDTGRDAGRSSHGVCRRHEAQRQRPHDELDRLTWADSGQEHFFCLRSIICRWLLAAKTASARRGSRMQSTGGASVRNAHVLDARLVVSAKMLRQE